MVKKIDHKESGWTLARVWLDALEETARDFHGIRPRSFVSRAYEHATENWLRILEDEYGLRPKEAKTIKEAVESYIEIGVAAGLFEDPSQFEVTEVTPYRVDLSVLSCPYLQSCRDLLNRGFTLNNLTCARIGCFRAAVELLTDIECTYEVTSVNLTRGCQGIIERI
jgi:hypothetical protein